MARPKTTAHMTPEELRECIEETGGLTQTANKTGISYRALQEYAKGERGIPAAAAKKLRELREDWRRYWTDWRQRFEAELDRDYPNGI